ncbi:MAG: Hsp70 family protein [Desulfitobacteriaceae bacterium]|nr:Hsp70 family protein [Desulfitobacteriaceae bacterium]
MAVDNELNPVLGIDLGTTFSAVARWDGRGSRVYQTKTGEDTLQSVVYLDPETQEMLVGKLAYRKGLITPENMVMGAKRKMDNAQELISLAGKKISPIDLSAEILKRMYADVREKYPPGRFRSRGTVVTVPYYFKAHQCENTRLAAEKADIECAGIIQESIAASLSYAWQLVQDHPEREGSENILVFDLGGGTFDLTLFKLTQSKEKLIFEVLGTGGDDRLGGLDFDECLVRFLIQKENIYLTGLSPLDERKAHQKILAAANEAKITLSAVKDAYVTVTDYVPGKHLDTKITREEFEACIEKYTDEIQDIIGNLWGASNTRPQQIDRVLRVGGSSNIPRMKDLLADMVGADKLYGNTNFSLCVAEGAALYAAYLDDREVFGRDIDIQTRTCHALGVETAGGVFFPIIPANRKTPCQSSQVFTTDVDGATALDINVYQGSSRLVKANVMVGNVNISGLPARSRRELDINVTFKVNEEQALSVVVEAEGMRKSAVLRYS